MHGYIRQLNRQEVVSAAREAARFRSDPAIAPGWAKGLSKYPDMPTEELAAFSGAITDEALFFQGVFALHQSAQLDLKVYQAYLDWFVCIVATPGGKAWWNIVAKPIFLSDMVEEIDQRPSRGEIPDIRKLPRLSVEEWSGV